ncbi:hypothetical protein GA0074692_6706 [Micromonospora pallida]|uniref:Uncharacterized protein n=1 Tax=Micromonospora pallida TaxID=145854 RepID=A0A1C6TKC6_9ACTN|nr:hypothetical protein [Micromonospora pallida]SCL42199.1 hypothetical protein GA0074692_6706 [Micromonospora pallida]
MDPGVGSVVADRTSAAVRFDLWRLVTARFNLATGLHELWVGADATASQTFTTPGAQSYTLLEIGTGWSGALAHVQVR